MKSHVREHQFSNIISNSYQKIQTDEGEKIILSGMMQDLITAQAPELEFSDWIILPDKTWSVNVKDTNKPKKLTITGTSVMDCIKKAKDIFQET